MDVVGNPASSEAAFSGTSSQPDDLAVDRLRAHDRVSGLPRETDRCGDSPRFVGTTLTRTTGEERLVASSEAARAWARGARSVLRNRSPVQPDPESGLLAGRSGRPAGRPEARQAPFAEVRLYRRFLVAGSFERLRQAIRWRRLASASSSRKPPELPGPRTRPGSLHRR